MECLLLPMVELATININASSERHTESTVFDLDQRVFSVKAGGFYLAASSRLNSNRFQ